MIHKSICSAMAVAATLVFAVSAANADVTLKLKTTTHSPMMDKMEASMSPDQRATIDETMSKMAEQTEYFSGKRMRMDSAIFSIISDVGTKTMIMANNNSHKYALMPMSKDASKMIAAATPGVPAMDPSAVKVTDTGKTTTFLGHKCRHYIMTMSMDIPNSGNMTVHSDILAAQDLPGLDDSVYEAVALQMGYPGAIMKGVPLLVEGTVSNATIGTMTTRQEAVSISTKPIQDSIFGAPAGYTETSLSDLMSNLVTPAVGH